MIVEMNDQMQHVEAHLGDMGKKCNYDLLEKKVVNLRAWDNNKGTKGTLSCEALVPLSDSLKDRIRYTYASQLSVLHRCPEVISRLLKSGQSILLAAKVLVISRLLHKKLSQDSDPPPFLESLRNRLSVLRRKLLARIDNQLQSLTASRETLVDAMCAFSIATSSTPTDVLRHYHHLRLKAMRESAQQAGKQQGRILQALVLYIKTLKETHDILPTHFGTALGTLRSIPLIRGDDVHSLTELDLDIHERWLGDDIKAFTPFVRHDEITKSGTRDSLKQWAKQAFACLLDDLRQGVKLIDEPKTILALRKQILDFWLSNSRLATGVNPQEALDDLREAFNFHFTTVIRQHTTRLKRVASSTHNCLENWERGTSDSHASLWESSVTSMEISRGASAFRETLASKLHGNTSSLHKVTTQYTNWLSDIRKIDEALTMMRDARWEDGVDEIEDDDLLDDRRVILSEDDPRSLQDELATSLENAFLAFQTSVEEADVAGDTTATKAAFLLRIWRHIRRNLPQSYHHGNIGIDSLPKLHDAVARSTIKAPIANLEKRLPKLQHTNKVVGRPLWEGNPELPVLPSPWAFRFLQGLAAAMTELGSDIWSLDAVEVLKRRLRSKLAAQLSKEVDPLVETNGLVNGEVKPEVEEPKAGEGWDDAEKAEVPEALEEAGGSQTVEIAQGSRDAAVEAANDAPDVDSADGPQPPENVSNTKIQKLFDLLYLSTATALKQEPQDDDPIVPLQKFMEQDLALEESSNRRMRRAAEEYWKRTSLLFALIA